MKIDWKKTDKQFYLPKNRPELIDLPPFQFFTIKGAGNPNDEAFGEYIGVLYSLAYAIRMSPKQGTAPHGYYEYTVSPWKVFGTCRSQQSGWMAESWTKTI